MISRCVYGKTESSGAAHPCEDKCSISVDIHGWPQCTKFRWNVLLKTCCKSCTWASVQAVQQNMARNDKIGININRCTNGTWKIPSFGSAKCESLMFYNHEKTETHAHTERVQAMLDSGMSASCCAILWQKQLAKWNWVMRLATAALFLYCHTPYSSSIILKSSEQTKKHSLHSAD